MADGADAVLAGGLSMGENEGVAGQLMQAIIAADQLHFNRVGGISMIHRLLVIGLVAGLAYLVGSKLNADERSAKAPENERETSPPSGAGVLLQDDSDDGPKLTLLPRESVSLVSPAGTRRTVPKKPLSPNFVDGKLDEVLKWCAKELDLQVFFDRPALADEGIALDHSVTIQLNEVPAESVLELILEPLQLGYRLRDETVLFVTTQPKLSEWLETRIYDVADLVNRDKDDGAPTGGFNKLIDLVITTVEPESWDAVGGPGSVRDFSARGIHVLVIRQTDRIHSRIDRLLAVLRSLRHEPAAAPRTEKAPQVGSATAVRPQPDVAARQVGHAAGIASDNAQFACDLYARLRKPDEENLAFSPFSISSALAMAYAGAGGRTATDMARTMHFTRPPDELHAGFSALRDSLVRLGSPSGVELKIANRLWGQDSVTFRESFLATLRERYGADLVRLPFSQSTLSANTINAWINDQTAGKIRNLVSSNDLNELTALVLTNAVYFKGQWKDPFRPALTIKAHFDTGHGKRLVHMMHQAKACHYFANDNLQIVDLSYEGERCSMMIILPNKHGNHALPELEERLSGAALATWASGLEERKVEIYMPRFKVESSYDLFGSLSALGMGRCFDYRIADFSRMSDAEGIEFSKVIHKAYVAVDEEGTEAAAATAVIGGFGGPAPVVKIPVFRADRPFLFLIRDRSTSSILFLGRVVDPPEAD